MSHRDSDLKLRHSKFDREPSPKRYRRDGKQERERERERERDRDRGRDRDGEKHRERDRDGDGDRDRGRDRNGEKDREREKERDRVTTNAGGGGGGDQNPVDRDQRNLPPPPPHHSKQESIGATHKKSDSNDQQELPKQSSQPPRSRSYYQHDEWGNTEKVGRSAGRREAGGKVFAQSKENNERVETSQSREQRDEKSQAKLDDNLHRRDFPERKDDPPPTIRKRPAFREKKIQGDSGDANPSVTERVKASHTNHALERNERKGERSGNPRHLDRHEKQIAEDRAPNRGEGRRDDFSSRARYGASGGNNNYRGRDKFNARQGYHPNKTQTEKWKHDLFQEAANDPVPKNEDDQIAKLEALLAS